MENIIEIQGVHKFFNKVHALNNLNMQVKKGEVYGFLGPNGAGKSTTIRALLGLIKVNQGIIKVFGKDSFTDSLQIHKKLTYVPGEVNLWGNLTGGEAIDLLHSFEGNREFNNEYKKAKQHYIELFDLDPSKKIRTYSKGNKQKVALVSAFTSRAELFVFDEPTSGLDPLMENIFQTCVLQKKQAGHTVLLSSHILSEVEKLADNIGIIKSGEIVVSGSLDSLRQGGSLESLFLSEYKSAKALV